MAARVLYDAPGVTASEAMRRLADLGVAASRGEALGAECDALVLDLWGGLDPDRLAAAVGGVRGGGRIVVARPDGELPPSPGAGGPLGSTFDRRFLASLPEIASPGPWSPPEPWSPPTGPFATDDQREAVRILVESLRRPGRPVVLVADRGRGKSAALGLAVAAALDEGREVVVTGPSRASVGALLARVGDRPGLRFVAPEAVDARRAGWLVVDEAAAVPLPCLLRWAADAPRVAFATTVHGYEGTGQAFALRFLPALRSSRPRAREVRLTQPARWDEGDPVEAWLSRVFLLAAESRPASPDAAVVHLRDLDEPTLADVHGLLVRAHYRTRPSDLRRLLDAPNGAVWAARDADGRIAGTAFAADEGGWTAEDAAAMAAGTMRPRGHLVPEVLASHLATPEGAELRGVRIVRVAVQEEARGRGLGRALVDAAAAGDWVGASFAADAGVLRFWRRLGFTLVHAGPGSLLVMRGRSEAGEALVEGLRRRFAEELPWSLREGLRHVDPAIVSAMTDGLPARAPTGQERRELAWIADHHRKVEGSLPALHAAIWGRPAADVLIRRVLQGWSWDEVAAERGEHRNEAIRAFRDALREIL